MTKIAFTTYEKELVELRSALRGDDFDKNAFIDKMKVIDEMIKLLLLTDMQMHMHKI